LKRKRFKGFLLFKKRFSPYFSPYFKIPARDYLQNLRDVLR
jgi:hypothetical protein